MQTNFLPFNFDPQYFYFRSTNVPRTQLSAESLLLGLYNTSSSSGAACDTAIFNIYTLDNSMENMYPNKDRCSTLSELETKWVSSNQFQAFYKEVIIPLSQQLSKIFQIPLDELDANAFFDCLQAHACHNMPLPDALTQQIYDTTVSAGVYYYKGLQNTPTIKNSTYVTIAMGDFVAELGGLIDQVVGGASTVKMALYSGHDTTLMPLLDAFGVWDGVWPPYASLLRVHLLKDDSNNYFVEFIYNDGAPLVIPGCQTSPCPYATFKMICNSVINTASSECSVLKPTKFFKHFGIPSGL